MARGSTNRCGGLELPPELLQFLERHLCNMWASTVVRKVGILTSSSLPLYYFTPLLQLDSVRVAATLTWGSETNRRVLPLCILTKEFDVLHLERHAFFIFRLTFRRVALVHFCLEISFARSVGCIPHVVYELLITVVPKCSCCSHNCVLPSQSGMNHWPFKPFGVVMLSDPILERKYFCIYWENSVSQIRMTFTSKDFSQSTTHMNCSTNHAVSIRRRRSANSATYIWRHL